MPNKRMHATRDTPPLINYNLAGGRVMRGVMPLIIDGSVMKTVASLSVTFLLLLSPLPIVYAQDETPADYIGRPASASDSVVERAVEESFRLNEPRWKLSAHYDSSPGTSYWEWKDGRREVRVIISYLASQKDATRRVAYSLTGIALPKYRPIHGVGDEAYLITGEGPILFRAKSVVVDVSGHRVKISVMRRFAERIASAVRAA